MSPFRISGKWRWVIATSCVALVLIAVVGLMLMRPRPILRGTLEITGYKRWPGGEDFRAELRLVNNTTNIIEYPLLREMARTPAIVARELTSTGWTAVQWEAYAKNQVFVMRKLRPGESVELSIPLTRSALPKKIALQCENLPEVKRPKFARQLRRWAIPVCRFLKINLATPEALLIEDQRIWCKEVIDPSKLENDKR